MNIYPATGTRGLGDIIVFTEAGGCHESLAAVRALVVVRRQYMGLQPPKTFKISDKLHCLFFVFWYG